MLSKFILHNYLWESNSAFIENISELLKAHVLVSVDICFLDLQQIFSIRVFVHIFYMLDINWFLYLSNMTNLYSISNLSSHHLAELLIRKLDSKATQHKFDLGS